MWNKFEDENKTIITINNKDFFKIPVDKNYIKNNIFKIIKKRRKYNQKEINIKLNQKDVKDKYYICLLLTDKNYYYLYILRDFSYALVFLLLQIFIVYDIFNTNKNVDNYYIEGDLYNLKNNSDCRNLLEKLNVSIISVIDYCNFTELNQYKFSFNLNNSIHNNNYLYLVILFLINTWRHVIYIFLKNYKKKIIINKKFFLEYSLNILNVFRNMINLLLLLILKDSNYFYILFYLNIAFLVIICVLLFVLSKYVDQTVQFFRLEFIFNIFFLVLIYYVIWVKLELTNIYKSNIIIILMFSLLYHFLFLFIVTFNIFKKIEFLFKLYYVYIFFLVYGTFFFVISILINNWNPKANELAFKILSLITFVFQLISWICYISFYIYGRKIKIIDSILNKNKILKDLLKNEVIEKIEFNMRYVKHGNNFFKEIIEENNVKDNEDVLLENIVNNNKIENNKDKNNKDKNNDNIKIEDKIFKIDGKTIIIKKEEDICYVCLTNKPNLLITNCNHGNLCKECGLINWSYKLNCNFCNKKIFYYLELEEVEKGIYEVIYYYLKK